MSFTEDFIKSLKFNKSLGETVHEVNEEILEDIKNAVDANSGLEISLDEMKTTDRNVFGFEIKAKSQDKIVIKVTVKDVLDWYMQKFQRLPEVVNKQAVRNAMEEIILNRTSALNIFR